MDNVTQTEIWLGNEEDDTDDDDFNPLNRQSVLIIGFVKFIFFWQYAFRVSDVGITGLFAFIAGFILMLSHFMSIKPLEDFAAQLPKSVYAARKLLGKDKDLFTKYACCPSCSESYPLSQLDLLQNNSGILTCTRVKFSDHPQLWRRKPCGTKLLKKVKSSAGKTLNKPQQVYSYKSIIDSMKELLSQPDFLKKCEEWRTWQQDPDNLSDIYDGRVWQQFMVVNGIPFLSLPYNFTFSLNVDWFQPYKHTKHSVGVLYLAVQNLPRRDRFLAENIVIVGVIPGPREPSKHITSFLNPLNFNNFGRVLFYK